MDIDPDTQMARYEAFEQQAAPIERRALARYDEARARLEGGDAAAAVPLLEAALADLREVEALQQALLPDLEGGVRERTLVETVLRSARAQAAPGTS